MDTSEAIISDWEHSDGGVKLKSAGSEGDHGVSEANILICKALNVAHHLGLTGDLLKLRLL
jgi:hypothetical protein